VPPMHFSNGMAGGGDPELGQGECLPESLGRIWGESFLKVGGSSISARHVTAGHGR
jgi:hypothetical protein